MPTKKTKETIVEIEPKENVVEIATPGLITPVKYFYATADFEIPKLDIHVKAGEQFNLPHGWIRDPQHEEFLLASKRKNAGIGEGVGMAFTYLGEVVNPTEKELALRERRVHTAVLPLEER